MPDDLVAPEGVDEGSAASSTEGEAHPSADVTGAPPVGDARTEADAAPPVPPHTTDPGPGQQLAEGEG